MKSRGARSIGALDRLPQWVRQKHTSREAKLGFTKQYVANEILYRKAKRLRVDYRPETRLKIAEPTKSLMVRKVISDELKENLSVPPAHVELYYKANLHKYVENAIINLMSTR